MFSIFRSKKEQTPEPQAPKKQGVFQRFKKGLAKTRRQLSVGLKGLLHKNILDETTSEALETMLLSADMGLNATETIMRTLNERLKKQDKNALQVLRDVMVDYLKPYEKNLQVQDAYKPNVWLFVGVNGVGKTTSIGKLAYLQKQNGQDVLLAAGDTFRAAAVEQLKIWGERNEIDVIAQAAGADSASVIYDGVHAARARKKSIILADTAGRLHTQSHLMDELKKITRVIKKVDVDAPHEVILVLDATIGQNTINQARQFHEDVGITGIILTKLDGTAKGGIIFALTDLLKLPIYYIGVGEQLEDCRAFNAEYFVDALLDMQDD